MNRRDFLKAMGATTGAALAAGCERAGLPDFISPVLPGDTLPGNAKLVPSICTECPAGCAMIVKVRDGHPVKHEGAPGSALCMRGQASLSRFYHPGRLKSPMLRGQNISWEEAVAAIEGALGKPGPHAFLSSRTTGALSELIDGFCQKRSVERLPEFEVYSYAAIRKANEIVFGKAALPFYDVKQADFLLTVGVDVIETFANPVQFAHDLSEAKLKWVHAESGLSLTGINADERIVIPPGTEAEFLTNLPEKVATALKNAKRPLVIANGSAALPAAKMQKALNSPLDFDRGLDYSRAGTLADLDKLHGRSFGVLFIPRRRSGGVPAKFRRDESRVSYRLWRFDERDAAEVRSGVAVVRCAPKTRCDAGKSRVVGDADKCSGNVPAEGAGAGGDAVDSDI